MIMLMLKAISDRRLECGCEFERTGKSVERLCRSRSRGAKVASMVGRIGRRWYRQRQLKNSGLELQRG